MFEEFKMRELQFVTWIKNPVQNEMLRADCREFERTIKEATESFREKCIHAGGILCKIKREGIYERVARDEKGFFCFGDAYLKDGFIMFCETTFHLSRTTIYNLMAVYEKFTEIGGKIKKTLAEYSYSQLLEMTSMTEEQRERVSPSMSVRDMQKMKREDKKYKTADNTVMAQKSDVEKKKTETCVFDDMKKKRAEFQKVMKQFFDKFNYKLTLNERGQSGQVFAGVFFDYLEKEGYFNENSNIL